MPVQSVLSTPDDSCHQGQLAVPARRPQICGGGDETRGRAAGGGRPAEERAQSISLPPDPPTVLTVLRLTPWVLTVLSLGLGLLATSAGARWPAGCVGVHGEPSWRSIPRVGRSPVRETESGPCRRAPCCDRAPRVPPLQRAQFGRGVCVCRDAAAPPRAGHHRALAARTPFTLAAGRDSGVFAIGGGAPADWPAGRT